MSQLNSSVSPHNSAFDLIGLTKLRNDPQFAGIDGSGLSVAVIDAGIDTSQPLVASNYLGGYDFIDYDDDPADASGHGTHISGIIGATDQEIGIAPEVGLIGLRVLDNSGNSFLTKVEDSLEWVLENKEQYNISVVNLSLGFGFFSSEPDFAGDVISDDIKKLEQAGVTVVTAAGNNYFANAEKSNRANLAFPAITSTIAVGAVWHSDKDSATFWQDGSIDHTGGKDRIASFSQRLDSPNLIFAPGVAITSTTLGTELGTTTGTSQAAPHVSGVVALMQSAALKFSGQLLAPSEIAEILNSTGDQIVDGDDEDDNVSNTGNTYSRLNAYRAIAEVKRRADSLDNLDRLDNPTLLTEAELNSSDSATVHRFYRADLGVHFYTADQTEKESVSDNSPQFNYEGESFTVPKTAVGLTGAKPVHRFLNTDVGTHLFTIFEAETDFVSENLSNYSYEGVAYYGYENDGAGDRSDRSGETFLTPLYRFYNVGAGVHFYTPSAVEKEYVLNNLPNYQLENNESNGVAFYVEPISEI